MHTHTRAPSAYATTRYEPRRKNGPFFSRTTKLCNLTAPGAVLVLVQTHSADLNVEAQGVVSSRHRLIDARDAVDLDGGSLRRRRRQGSSWGLTIGYLSPAEVAEVVPAPATNNSPKDAPESPAPPIVRDRGKFFSKKGASASKSQGLTLVHFSA